MSIPKPLNIPNIPINVGDLRKTMEHLSDDSRIVFHWGHTRESVGQASVQLTSLEISGGCLVAWILIDVKEHGEIDES